MHQDIPPEQETAVTPASTPPRVFQPNALKGVGRCENRLGNCAYHMARCAWGYCYYCCRKLHLHSAEDDKARYSEHYIVRERRPINGLPIVNPAAVVVEQSVPPTTSTPPSLPTPGTVRAAAILEWPYEFLLSEHQKGAKELAAHPLFQSLCARGRSIST